MPQAPQTLTRRKAKANPTRRHAAARGYGWRWQQHTKLHKARWPYCAHCLRDGKYNAGTAGRPNHVDHITRPDSPTAEAFWDTANHQTLCHRCHAIKTGREDGNGYDTTRDKLDRRRQLSQNETYPHK